MTTAEMYRVPEEAPATTAPDVLGLFHQGEQVAGAFWLREETTEMQERNRRLRRELATRSVAADSGLDRDLLLSDEVHRHAWGISGE